MKQKVALLFYLGLILGCTNPIEKQIKSSFNEINRDHIGKVNITPTLNINVIDRGPIIYYDRANNSLEIDTIENLKETDIVNLYSFLSKENFDENFNLFFNWYGIYHEYAHFLQSSGYLEEYEDFYRREFYANEYALKYLYRKRKYSDKIESIYQISIDTIKRLSYIYMVNNFDKTDFDGRMAINDPAKYSFYQAIMIRDIIENIK